MPAASLEPRLLVSFLGSLLLLPLLLGLVLLAPGVVAIAVISPIDTASAERLSLDVLLGVCRPSEVLLL